MVSVKVLRNDKDCVDQGLGEVKLLTLIAQSRDSHADLPLLQLLDYFYYKEHLFIVTELLRDSLFNFYRYLNATQPLPQSGSGSAEAGTHSSGAYFTLDTIAKLAAQLLKGLAFLHSLNITHCDVKPENVCIVSASKREFKLIDFGSAIMDSDCHNSYVQSRWYRAPEVMLGLPWDSKVDVWGVGCILAELIVGQPIFYGGSVELVLAAHAAVLGPHPKHMMTNSELAHLYFTSDGQVYSIEPAGEKRAGVMTPLKNVNLKSLTKVEDEGFLSFLKSLLSIDPEQRPTAAEALSDPWLQQALEPTESADGARHPFFDRLHGYQSPSTSRGGSSPNSISSSPVSSQHASRDASPMHSFREGEDTSLPDGRRRSRSKSEQRRCMAGPGVPEEFRDEVQKDASRSNEWRDKLVRLIAGGVGAPFHMRSNRVATSPPAVERGTSPQGLSVGAPPPSSLHRPKMRL